MNDDEEDEDDYLFIIDQTARDFLIVKAPDYEGYNNRQQRDRKVLFIPSILSGNLFCMSFLLNISISKEKWCIDFLFSKH